MKTDHAAGRAATNMLHRRHCFNRQFPPPTLPTPTCLQMEAELQITLLAARRPTGSRNQLPTRQHLLELPFCCSGCRMTRRRSIHPGLVDDPSWRTLLRDGNASALPCSDPTGYFNRPGAAGHDPRVAADCGSARPCLPTPHRRPSVIDPAPRRARAASRTGASRAQIKSICVGPATS
jgi:hypothetical protein